MRPGRAAQSTCGEGYGRRAVAARGGVVESPRSSDEAVKYTVVIEETDNGYSAYAPDVPGCVAAGDTVSEVEDLIREALVFHIESLREHGEPVPEPRASAALVEV